MTYRFDPDNFGNVCLVDQSNGQDEDGRRGGFPFATLSAAVSAASSGDQVWIMPGTYNLSSGLTIPSGVCIRGASLNTVTIQATGVASSIDLITMGSNSRLEDITLNLTSSGHYNLKGIVFPGTTTTTAKVQTVTLTVDNSSASSVGTSEVYGIHSSGTGNPDIPFGAVRYCNVLVSSTGSGRKRGLYNDSASLITVKDSSFIVSGASSLNTVAVETNSASSYIYGFYSIAQGASADLSQSAGVLQWQDSTLINGTSNGLPYNTGSTSSAGANPLIIFSTGPNTIGANQTNFLLPGTAKPTTSEVVIPIPKRASLQNLFFSCPQAPTNPATVTIRKNNADTALAATLAAGETSVSNTTTSVIFNAGDYLSIKVVTGGGGLQVNAMVVMTVQ